jgi:hypothetical protein
VCAGIGCNAVLGIEDARLDPSLASCGAVAPQAEGLVRVCLLRVSCYPLLPRFTISDCISFNTVAFTSYESCMQDADDCSDVTHCTGLGYLEDTTLCEGVTAQWICNDDVAIRCGSSSPYTVDCGRLGATCETYSPGTATDGARPCRVNEPGVCEGSSDTWRCNGEIAYHCIEGKAYGQACSQTQSICNEDLPGSAYCNDITSTCTDRGTVRCDANSVTVCDTGGYFARYDCAPAGGTCDTDGTSVGYCVLPGCNKDSGCEEECLADGVTMKLCIAGAPFPVDCTSYGFSACGVYTDPRSRSDYVACE